MDVDLDSIALDLLLPAVKLLLDLAPRQDPAGMDHEGMQNRVFAPRQADGFALVFDILVCRIEPQAAPFDKRLRPASGTADERAQPRRDLVEVERLAEIVVGPASSP